MSVWVFPPLAPIWHLDVLVLLMCSFTVYHAYTETDKNQRKENFVLMLTATLLGLFTEHASLRFGGTHCHASGLINFSECSSANSVMYYLPWVYGCITTARALTRKNPWMFKYLTAMLFFGLCGVYEMQGPLMGWWLWPQADGIIKPGATLWQFGDPGNDSRGMVTTGHVAEALGERIYGFPPMAPYFHSAFGWGIAVALQLTVPSFSGKSSSSKTMTGGTFAALIGSVLLGPALGMSWDPIIRVLKNYVGASKAMAVPAVMGLAFVVPLLLGTLDAAPSTLTMRNACLLIVPLLNHSYFVHNAFFGHGKNVIPGNLKLGVLCVATVSLIVHARAAGVTMSSVKAFLARVMKSTGKTGIRNAAADVASDDQLVKRSARSSSRGRRR